MKSQFLISSTTAGSGKTVFAMGLLRALQKRGWKVQPYKTGPDFIDTQLLSLSAGTEAVNLDSWMASYTHVQYLYNKYGEKADICLTEGVAALFDGYKRMQGSSAEMAQLLHLPIILLINARSAGYSVAPIIYGFRQFYSGVRIAGVVFNQVSSPAHFAYLKEACSDAGVDCLGYLPISDVFKLPTKHSSLTQSSRRELDVQIDAMAELIDKQVDIDRLLNRCQRSFPCPYTLPYSSDVEIDSFIRSTHKIRIAVARDSAFNLMYRENMAKLNEIGKITFFSPIYGHELPPADLVYFPGGYIELFARQLHRQKKMMESIQEYAEKGGKVWAEGGGATYLGQALTAREGGTAYEMCKILPFHTSVTPNGKLKSGYRKCIKDNQEWKGYEFQYTSSTCSENLPVSLSITNLKGSEEIMPFYRYKNVIASHTHWYWGDKDLLKWWEV